MFIEAYHRNTLQRFNFGTVSQPRPPENTVLDQLDLSGPVLFRVRVVDQSNNQGQLIASTSGLRAEGDDDAAFLATGLHDDLLTQLAKIASLDVIARTSVMQYAGTEKSITTIGRELDVHTVLEGSVLQAGGQVRLNVQLIDAGTNTHLWAESYDRDFTVANVFAIQSDLAQQIVGALEAELA